jgi:hypothetical protein
LQGNKKFTIFVLGNFVKLKLSHFQ